jgi:O-glycosyl hydrolase
MFIGIIIIGGILVKDNQQNGMEDEQLVFDPLAINIQPDDGYDEFEGWGTSLAWWGHILGQWKDEEKMNEVMDLVFDENKGLGLNIIRYNIGGGENPNIEENTLRPGGDVPGFQPEEGEWDWEADVGQRTVMLAAFKRGATIAEAFSNSPPYWMTKSGSVTGSVDGGNNLKDEYYDEFADYLTEVVKVYREKYNVTFRTLTPLNEPISNWWKKGNIQEGAHFNLEAQMRIIKKVAQSLEDKGLSDTAVSAADENSIDETLRILKGYDEETLGAITQINTHSYSGSRLDDLNRFAEENGKKLWMSEFGAGGTEPHNHEDISSVMQLAERIIFDLTLLQPSAWIYWQAVEDESAKNNWGFIHADFRVGENYELTKQYYAMANFSKFIRPGSRIILTTDGRSVAAYNEEQKQLTIVVRNESKEEKELAYDLSEFHFETRSADLYETSTERNLEKSELKIYSNGFKIIVENQSIATIVIGNVEIK